MSCNTNLKGPPYFRMLREVEVLAVTSDAITYTTDARLTTATDESDDYKRRIQGTFVTKISNLWCTSGGTIDGRPFEASVKLRVGSRGPLYIEKDAAGIAGTSLEGDVYARGVRSPLLKDEMAYKPKWPDGGDAEGLYSSLAITTTKAMFTGYVPGSDKRPPAFDLYNSAYVKNKQLLQWGGGTPLALELTKDGFDLFGATWPGTGTTAMLHVWPIAIKVYGKPTAGGVSSNVDLRDLQYSAAGQKLLIDATDRSVTLELSDRGKKLFNARTKVPLAAITRLKKMSPEEIAAVHQLLSYAAELDEDVLAQLRGAASSDDFVRAIDDAAAREPT